MHSNFNKKSREKIPTAIYFLYKTAQTKSMPSWSERIYLAKAMFYIQISYFINIIKHKSMIIF